MSKSKVSENEMRSTKGGFNPEFVINETKDELRVTQVGVHCLEIPSQTSSLHKSCDN